MTKSTTLLTALALFAAASLRAQTYEQVAPKTLPPAPPATLPEAPVATPDARDEDRVLVPALRGLVFLADRAALQPAGSQTEGVQTSAVPLLDRPDVRARLAAYLGRPLTLGRLREITREAVLALRQQDRPVVDVVVPEQNIQSGTVQLVVVEGRLGRVSAEGNRWFSSARLVEAVRLQPGEVIAGDELLSDLAWLNENPFRRVDLVFARGEGPGETDVILRTQDRRPWRVYAGYENTGTPLTDEDRVLAGVNWGDAFGRGQLLNYQFSASPDFEKFRAHSASYVAPLPWRHTLTFFGSYATSRPELPGGLFKLAGESSQLSARYRVPLRAWHEVTQSFTAGLDFKRSDNDLAFGGTRVFAQSTDVIQAVFAYSASRSDARGFTAGELTLALSPGGIGGSNSKSDFRNARSYADSEYATLRLAVDRTTTLGGGWRWLARGEAQTATTNLLGSEQLGLGGSTQLRGYDEREANGDYGAYLVNELRAPAFSLGERLGRTGSPDRLEPLVFFDAGVVGVHRALPGEDKNTELMSVGVGLRYAIGGAFSLRFDYGWQLRDTGLAPGRANHRGHIGVTCAY